jgi:hypothetical protein
LIKVDESVEVWKCCRALAEEDALGPLLNVHVVLRAVGFDKAQRCIALVTPAHNKRPRGPPSKLGLFRVCVCVCVCECMYAAKQKHVRNAYIPERRLDPRA